MYIFKYQTKAGKELGYHLSTMCQIGPKESAKRYKCTNGPEAQMETILKNLKAILETEDTDGFFSGMFMIVKEQFYQGLTFEDIVLIPEEVEDVQIDLKIHTIITDGEVKHL